MFCRQPSDRQVAACHGQAEVAAIASVGKPATVDLQCRRLPLAGVAAGHRLTQRLKRSLSHGCPGSMLSNSSVNEPKPPSKVLDLDQQRIAFSSSNMKLS